MIDIDINEAVNGLFKSLLNKNQKPIETVKGVHCDFNSTEKLYNKFLKVSLIRDSSYIPTPELMKNKKATVSVRSDGNKCFQYSVINALH